MVHRCKKFGHVYRCTFIDIVHVKPVSHGAILHCIFSQLQFPNIRMHQPWQLQFFNLNLVEDWITLGVNPLRWKQSEKFFCVRARYLINHTGHIAISDDPRFYCFFVLAVCASSHIEHRKIAPTKGPMAHLPHLRICKCETVNLHHVKWA